MGSKRNRSRMEVWMFVKDGGRIRRRRKDRGLSQVQLAALCGCSQQYISLVEQGDDSDVSEKIAEKICRWLEVDLEDYFDERRTVRTSSVASASLVGGRS